MNTSTNILNHRCYNEQDYERLQAKGYSDEEIEKIWNDDLQRQIVADLLWLDAHQPEVAKKILEDYRKNRKDNPFAEELK